MIEGVNISYLQLQQWRMHVVNVKKQNLINFLRKKKSDVSKTCVKTAIWWEKKEGKRNSS